MNPEFSIIIPARFASTRLPGKMLLDIAGKPMIEYVYRRALESKASRVAIATDHEDIANAAKSFGAEVVMTSEEHPSGTDRLQEACAKCQFGSGELVVNIQGDEPLIPAAVINQVAELLANDKTAKVATLAEPINQVGDFLNPNVVKVIADKNQHALYFSRAPIPWPRDEFANNQDALPNNNVAMRHLGIYAYRVELLNQFVKWPQAQLETIEKLEQLRVLANGEKIAVAEACDSVPGGVDTQADLDNVRRLLQN